MALDAISVLTSISVILLVGIILTVLSERLRMSNVLFLILGGILLSFLEYNGEPIIQFPPIFLTATALVALSMIVFDSSSHFKKKQIETEASKAIKVTALFILVCLVVLSIFTYLLFSDSFLPNPIFFSILFASMMVGTDPSAVLAIFKDAKQKAVEFLEVESIINTPMTVILPFIVVSMAGLHFSLLLSKSIEQIAPFIQKFVTGIGTGVFLGLIVFWIMKKQYSKILSPLTLIASALLTFAIAEELGGDGVLAVATLGFVFGSFYIREKEELRTIGELFSNMFEILVFVLLGIAFQPPSSGIFYIKAAVLFIVYVALRFIVINLLFKNDKDFSFGEKFFISLNSAKGVAVAVVLLTLTFQGILSADHLIIDLALVFIIYSVIFSTFVVHFSRWFGFEKEKIKKKK